MVYTYGNKDGRERDKLDDTEESPTPTFFLFSFPIQFSLCIVYANKEGRNKECRKRDKRDKREQGGPEA